MSEQTNPIISFKNFSFQYRAQKKPTLHDINLDIYPGERVLIAGPSGSGKSTLAACINGLNPFSYPGECTGSLTVDGVDAPNSSIFELSAHVGTVLQDPDGQFIGLTVGEDIAFALENSCVPQKEMHEITRHAAELVGIENRLDHAPHELSGCCTSTLAMVTRFFWPKLSAEMGQLRKGYSPQTFRVSSTRWRICSWVISLPCKASATSSKIMVLEIIWLGFCIT